MITGNFTQINVPSEINTGEDLIIKVRFRATNTDGSWFNPWKTFLIADIPVMGRYELDAARRYSRDIDTGEKTYNLGPVPSINADKFAISLFIFGHQDANYDWDWVEYDVWMDGYPVSFTHLDSEFRWVTVTEPNGEPPPDDGAQLSGVITQIVPTVFSFGDPIDIYVSFNAYADTVWEQIKGWDTRVTARFNGWYDYDDQFHLGRDGSRDRQDLHLGAMPERDISGVVTLEGRGRNLLGQPTNWVTLDTRDLTIEVYVPPGNGGPPPGNGEPGEGVDWLPAVLIGGGVAVALIALSKPGGKKQA